MCVFVRMHVCACTAILYMVYKVHVSMYVYVKRKLNRNKNAYVPFPLLLIVIIGKGKEKDEDASTERRGACLLEAALGAGWGGIRRTLSWALGPHPPTGTSWPLV